MKFRSGLLQPDPEKGPNLTPKNLVLRSIELPGGARCVDLFQRPDGSFGFEEYRRDPEDGRGWFPVANYAGLRFQAAEEALAAARASLPWLEGVLGGGLGRRPYSSQVGSRFSRKALMPSRPSGATALATMLALPRA